MNIANSILVKLSVNIFFESCTPLGSWQHPTRTDMGLNEGGSRRLRMTSISLSPGSDLNEDEVFLAVARTHTELPTIARQAVKTLLTPHLVCIDRQPSPDLLSVVARQGIDAPDGGMGAL